MSRRIQVAVGIGLAALLVYLFLRQADLHAVGDALRLADFWLIGVAVLLMLLNQVQRAWRWHYLLLPLASVPTRPLLECTLMGWGVTMVLPGRLGEVVRPVLLARRTQLRASAAIGSIVLERAFDGLTVLVILAVYLAFLPPPVTLGDEGRVVLETMRTTGMLLLAVLVVLGLLTVFAMRNETVRSWVAAMNERWLPERLGKLASSFLGGMEGLRSPLLIAMISLNSLLLWGTIIATYAVLFRAFDLQLPSYAAIPLVAILVIGVMIPTPGAIGSFHKAAQIGLVGLWAVDNDTAIAYAIVAHAVAFLPHGIIGLLLLAREGVSLSTVRGLGAESETGRTV